MTIKVLKGYDMYDLWGLIIFIVIGIYLYILNRDIKLAKSALYLIHSRLATLEDRFEHFIRTPRDAVAEPEPSDEAVPAETETTSEAAQVITSKDASESPIDTPEQPQLPPKAEKTTFESVEKDLSTRWMMWVGGIAFSLGGAFLVKYSIDAGLLNPAVRVTLGTILGIVMIGGGETLRVKRQNITWLDGAPDYLPSAISAAGLFTAFAAIYAAYALYGMIPALVAFAALAGLSFLSSALALVQGRFFAYIGLIGGLIIPALVSTSDSSAYKLFPYLLIIISSGLWVSRKRSWVDVPATAVFLGIFWVLTWIVTRWQPADIIPVGGYLIILGGLNTVLLRGATPARAHDNRLAGILPSHTITVVSDLSILMCVLLFVTIIRLDHYSAIAMIMGTLWLAGHAYAVSYSAENDGGGIISIFGVLFLLVTWHVPDLFEVQQMLDQSEALYFALEPIAPPGMEKFVTTSILLAGAISIGIFFWLPNFLRKTMWASVGAAVPIIILLMNYWRIHNLDTSIPFAFVSMALAGAFTFATVRINRSEIEGRNELLATYAAAATTAVALAIAMVLRDAWLSFALALEVLALGYIWRATAVKGLRTLALFLASIVLVRLFLNASIFGYNSGETLPPINWLFYAYGLSSLIFYYASKLFAQKENDRLLSVLTAGSIMLLITFITFEIHVLSVSNGKLSGIPTETEVALQTINWSVATALLFWRELKDKDRLLGLLRRFMTIISLIAIIVGGGVANNVYLNTSISSVTPILNIQLLQYFIPAMLFAIKAWLAHTGGRSRSLKYYGALAFAITWYWITAEVHVLSTMLDGSPAISDWERYGYSIAWLLYAVVLLVVGLVKNLGKVRLAGLFVLGIVVLKVFLVDMGELEGLARALSFMGLGAGLIGIGYLYQKLSQAEPADVTQES